MKTVFINESMIKRMIVQESALLKSLPLDILRTIDSKKTSLGNNPSLPEIYDMPFLLKITEKQFEKCKNALFEIGSIDDIQDTTIESALSTLILKCQEIERPFRNQLEKICYNYIINLFEVPEETVQLSISLTDNVNLDKESIILEPIDGDKDLEFNDLNDAMSIKDEVYKRRLLDTLAMGAGMEMSLDLSSIEKEIKTINPKLLDLYASIIAINNYLLFTKEDLKMSDDNKMQLGTVELSLGSNNEKVKIDAQGLIFPILLSETIRGFMELFMSHGLPKEMEKATMIIGKSDFLKAEPWDMRIGPALWELLAKNFKEVDKKYIPYIISRISKLDINKFNYLFKEIFAQTKRGKELIHKIVNHSINDASYDQFANKMKTMKQNNGLITDEFIHPEEL